MKHIAKSLCLSTIFVFTAITGCGDDSERQEQIQELRALGVEQSPIVAAPGSVVSLTFYLAAPQGLAIKPSPYIDTANRYGSNVSVTLIDAAPSEEKLGNISQYVLRAQYTVPSDAATVAFIAKKGSLRLRYGVGFDDGKRNEVIIGDTLVYSTNAPNWTAPTISIDQPLTTEISSTSGISSTIQNTNDETNLVSWFVSSGKVKNRNAKSTEWSEIGSGEQTLIVTTRGKKSGAFAIKTAKVTVR